MQDLVADPTTDLLAPIPHGEGQTILREALLVADHNAYHLGQLVTVRRLLGACGKLRSRTLLPVVTLALHTRAMPLIIDQPEDELGYSYVVHLVVPTILKAKFSRQILIVTHNANIPVLGEADYVIKMENRPRKDSGRTRVIAEAGSFESIAITKALIELEGGQRAFNFRRFRYAMSSNTL